MEECAKHVDLSTIMSLKSLLSWKVPENLSNANTNQLEESVETKVAGQASNAGGDLAKRLYKVDYITQRIKEQKIHMVGIVVYVKKYVSYMHCLLYKETEGGVSSSGNSSATTFLVLEGLEDKNRVTVFTKHSRKLEFAKFLEENDVVLFKNCVRKVCRAPTFGSFCPKDIKQHRNLRTDATKQGHRRGARTHSTAKLCSRRLLACQRKNHATPSDLQQSHRAALPQDAGDHRRLAVHQDPVRVRGVRRRAPRPEDMHAGLLAQQPKAENQRTLRSLSVNCRRSTASCRTEQRREACF